MAAFPRRAMAALPRHQWDLLVCHRRTGKPRKNRGEIWKKIKNKWRIFCWGKLEFLDDLHIYYLYIYYMGSILWDDVCIYIYIIWFFIVVIFEFSNFQGFFFASKKGRKSQQKNPSLKAVLKTTQRRRGFGHLKWLGFGTWKCPKIQVRKKTIFCPELVILKA